MIAKIPDLISWESFGHAAIRRFKSLVQRKPQSSVAGRSPASSATECPVLSKIWLGLLFVVCVILPQVSKTRRRDSAKWFRFRTPICFSMTNCSLPPKLEMDHFDNSGPSVPASAKCFRTIIMPSSYWRFVNRSSD